MTLVSYNESVDDDDNVDDDLRYNIRNSSMLLKGVKYSF